MKALWTTHHHRTPRNVVVISAPDVEARKVFFRAKLMPGMCYSLAVSLRYKGEMVGAVREHIRPEPLLAEDSTSYDFEIAIVPEAQGGVGAYLLLKETVERAKRKNVDLIHTSVINPVVHGLMVKHFDFLTLPRMDEDGDTERFPYFARVAMLVSDRVYSKLTVAVDRINRRKRFAVL